MASPRSSNHADSQHRGANRRSPSNSLTDDSSGWRDASLSAGSVHDSELVEEEEASVTLSQRTASASVHSDDDDESRSPPAHVAFEDISLEDQTASGDRSSIPSSYQSNRRPSRISLTEYKRRFSFYQSTCFADQLRLIDFVLCYETRDKEPEKEAMNAIYRLRFEQDLISQGFQLEYEEATKSLDGKTGFVKIHAPFAVLEKQAELKGLQRPFMESDVAPSQPGWWHRLVSKCCGGDGSRRDPFALQDEYQLPHVEYFTDSFEREHRSEFLNSDDELAFFAPSQRIYLTWDALSNTTIRLEERSEAAATFLVQMGSRRTRRDGPRPSDVSAAADSPIDVDEVEKGIPNGAYLPDLPDEPKLDPIDRQQTEEEANDEENQVDDDEDREEEDVDDSDVHSREKTASLHFLLQMGVYKSGFPLHDGSIEDDEETRRLAPVDWPLRKYLYESWARPRQWRRYQPIQKIREYYGEKVGLYFAWLGFYTQMLIAPSILGLLVTIYGVVWIFIDDNSEAVCEDPKVGNELMCPDCPTEACAYTKMKGFCMMTSIGAVFDNHVTVIFAVFMALWAITFLEMWKRYRCKLCVDWDVTDQEFDSEHVRPEYTLRVPDMKLNPITKKLEPHLRMSTKLKRVAASLATVLFFILIVVGLLAAVMIYKVIGVTWWKGWLGDQDKGKGESDNERNEYTLIVSVTSTLVNGLFIAIMTKVYMRIAWWLTQAEFPRTEKAFEHSYTYKVFIFQCVNFYGALFYLAVIRGRSSEPPHKQSSESRCPVSGCMVDVSIQMAIIMTGKQAINNVLELGLPLLRACVRKFKRGRTRKQQHDGSDVADRALPSWQRDAQLDENQRILLFSDYLELLIQYGFVTMFVVAFPLAPLFAFLNNIIEIRLDAYKTVVMSQRCVPLRAKNIGPWYRILKIVTRLAVIINALMIAFTTRFVDRFVYYLLDGQEFRQHHPGIENPKANFLYFTLSKFNISDYFKVNNTAFMNPPAVGSNSSEKYEYCYYADYRLPPEDPLHPYQRSIVWWHVLAAKFIFVILFEHFVMFFQTLLAYFIPDVPERERTRMAREAHIVKANFLKREFGDKAVRRGFDVGFASDSDENNDKFVPDELPDWLESTTTGGGDGLPPAGTRRMATKESRNPSADHHDERIQRGKVLVPKTKGDRKKRRRPFVFMLLRKLISCDDDS